MCKSPRGFTGWLGALLAVVLLTGCGYHLKGGRPLPPEMSVVHLDYRAYGYEVVQSRLEESLRAQLQRRGARVVTSTTDASGRLTVHRLDQKTRILSVGATGKAIEYEIEATVEFDYSVDGFLRVPRESMTVFREYSFDETRVLATEAYGDQLRREMQEELADLILLRIDAVLASTPGNPAPAGEPAG
jgi:LPS-assembly lipoprotein